MYKLFFFMLLCQGLVAAEIRIANAGRGSFSANEPEARLRLMAANCGQSASPAVELTGPGGFHVKLPELKPRGEFVFEVPIETRLLPGSYTVTLQADGSSWEAAYRIGPAARDIMPVVMWHAAGSNRVLQQTGFTHRTLPVSEAVFYRDDKKNADWKTRYLKELDEELANGFYLLDYLTAPHKKSMLQRFPRIGRDGKPINTRNANASHPEMVTICEDIAVQMSREFAGHPGLAGVLVSSEVRDGNQPSFDEHNLRAFRDFAGFEIPPEVQSRNGPHYRQLPEFPFSRIIPEDNPILVYYRWFWKTGDGWNPLNSAVSRIWRKAVRRPFWSFYDPAIRVPPVWGSGGEVDYLNQWTYPYPDPLRISAVTDEVRAMASGRPGQGIMAMTQAISYRSQIAPAERKVKNEPAWVRENPDAKYISTPPDLLLEAAWSKISRRLDGVMFHGFGSIFGSNRTGVAYTMTNPETRQVIEKFNKEVIRPLGPMLKRIPERAPQVAILHSFSSVVFAARGSWGWGGWLVDAHLMLQWGGLSPSVIYEEQILRDGFGELKILCLFHCDVLTEPVYRRILEFQEQGGLIIGDEFLPPGLTPDLVVHHIPRKPNAPAQTKDALQKAGLTLRKQLESYYRPYAATDNQDIIAYVRSSGEADYLFLVNDKRTFGDYVGQYGMVMEKGMPNSGRVAVSRRIGAAYDLMKHSAVAFTSQGSQTILQADFNTCDGKLYLLLPEPIGELEAVAPDSMKAGATEKLRISVLNSRRRPLAALIPLQIRLLAGDEETECFYTCTVDGISLPEITVPLNLRASEISVRIKELASGLSVTRMIKIE